ncbi:MAG: hypothetical protein OEO82_02565 [Gammaproteobacteria bacterium]|nr:hypothetical protein [Gammaproteobacteria bacterium]
MNKATLLAGIAALLLPLGLPAAGHEEQRPPLTEVWLVVPKPGMEAQFEQAVAAHMVFRDDAGDSRRWQAFTPVIGHNLNVYHFRACCFNWADQDAYIVEDREKSFSENWNANVHQYVDHYHHYLDHNDWENSHWPEDGADGPYYAATSWTWKQGAGPGPGQARQELSQMAINDGWAAAGHNWLWLERIGGEPTIAVVSPYASFADMAPPEQNFFEFIAAQMDSEEAAGALFAQFGGGFADSDYTVWLHRPDLSAQSEDD